MRLIAILLPGLLSACVGTADSLQEVRGESPLTGGGCELTVSAAGTSDVLARRKVRGVFVIYFLASGTLPSTVDIAGYCGGVKRKELLGVALRRSGAIEFGNLAP